MSAITTSTTSHTRIVTPAGRALKTPRTIQHLPPDRFTGRTLGGS